MGSHSQKMAEARHLAIGTTAGLVVLVRAAAGGAGPGDININRRASLYAANSAREIVPCASQIVPKALAKAGLFEEMLKCVLFTTNITSIEQEHRPPNLARFRQKSTPPIDKIQT